jgi:TonB family protein
MEGVRGKVTVRAEFDIDGNFEVLEVVESLGYGLDEAALAALDHWTFRPAYRSGRRVPVVANIDVEFDNPPNALALEAYRLANEALNEFTAARRQSETAR